MRHSRIKSETGLGCYHVVSRVVDRTFRLDDTEKEIFRCIMRKVAGFSGIEILTYVVMSNHFHILVRVPRQPELGEREVPLSREIWIEQDDFAENPPAGWQRLTVGGEVRLRYSYVIRCEAVIKNEAGEIIELHCSLDPDTLGKNPVGRKVKGVIHWVSCAHAVTATVRLYDRLFSVPRPDTQKDAQGNSISFTDFIHSASLTTTTAYIEAGIQTATPESAFQFERLGYFVTDRFEHQASTHLVFNRVVGLKDSWNKAA